MAGNPECMSGDGKGAIFLGTFLNDGTSVTVCEDHFTEFLAATLEALTGAPIAAVLAMHFEQQVSDEGIDPTVESEHDIHSSDESSSQHTATVDDHEEEHHEVTDDDVAEIISAANLDDADSTATN